MIIEFKIDTKPAYTIIAPATDIWNENLAGLLADKLKELRQSGSKNFIIDISGIHHLESAAITNMQQLQEDCYMHHQSLVYMINSAFLSKKINEADEDSTINITPTLAEAIDMVNMEIVERDLFNDK